MHYPENGFYYHYKHDPSGEFNNYAYEVMGIGHHTEVDGLDESAMVMYRPLYESSVYKIGKHWDLRPVAMFLEPVTKPARMADVNESGGEGRTFPRFEKILDSELTEKLATIRDTLYPSQ